MKRIEYFLDFQKLENITDESYWFYGRDKANFKYEFLKQTYLNKKSKPYRCPVTLFLGNKKFSLKCELDEILNSIKSGVTKFETEYYRNNYKEFDLSILNKQFTNSMKSFTPCGIFYNNKKRVEIRQLNGIVMLHNLYAEFSQEQLNLIKSNKLTYAFFELIDPNKYAVLVKTNGMTSKNYLHFQRHIQKYYSELLNENILKSTVINNAIYLSYDKYIYVNEHCTILSIKRTLITEEI